jgi:lipoprotein-anchoring transpeptidase ErfK/SrfK
LTGVPIARLHRRAVLSGVVTLVLVLGACGGERPELSDKREPTTTTAPPTSESTTTTSPAFAPSMVAQAESESIQVYDDPTIATATGRFDGGAITAAQATSAPGIPIVFLVKGDAQQDGRYEVYLPVRPNGSTGWVDAEDVTISSVSFRIKVAIAEHRLRVYDGEEVVLDEPIGVGKADTPSPGGVYYLKELLQPPDQTGPYGTYAYGLSGFSNELLSFNGGEGVIGIHGTNNPGSIGSDVSSGCIRLNNEVINRMVDEIRLPLGTPVEIDA